MDLKLPAPVDLRPASPPADQGAMAGAKAQLPVSCLLGNNPLFLPLIAGQEYHELCVPPKSAFNIAVFKVLFQLPLTHLTDTYSTGTKKKLAFRATLSWSRPLIILAEPFNGVDLKASFLFNKAIDLLRQQGKTVIITSHIYESLTGLCDQIHTLSTARSWALNSKKILGN